MLLSTAAGIPSAVSVIAAQQRRPAPARLRPGCAAARPAAATVGQLFNPALPAPVKDYIVNRYYSKLKYVDEHIVKVRAPPRLWGCTG